MGLGWLGGLPRETLVVRKWGADVSTCPLWHSLIGSYYCYYHYHFHCHHYHNIVITIFIIIIIITIDILSVVIINVISSRRNSSMSIIINIIAIIITIINDAITTITGRQKIRAMHSSSW